MSKEYIIKIEEEPLVRKSALHGETAVWRASGFNSLVFDQNGLDKLTPYKEDYTASQAWEAVRKIFNMEWDERHKLFGDRVHTLYEIFFEITADEAIERIKTYELEHNDAISSLENHIEDMMNLYGYTKSEFYDALSRMKDADDPQGDNSPSPF